MKEKRKVFQLNWLNVGDKFQYINEIGYRNCVIKRVSDCGVIINCEIKNGQDDNWRAVQGSHSVSGNSLVYLVD